MFIMPSLKKSLIVEQFQGDYLKEQCKFDLKPQKLEYKKVAKPSFQQERNWENIPTFPSSNVRANNVRESARLPKRHACKSKTTIWKLW